MCWSAGVSVGMVALGAGATALSWKRGDPAGIWGTIGYFTVMEGLQAVGYAVVDQCGTPENEAVTLLSYLHIAFQPIFINAFAMAVMADVGPTMRRWVWGLSGLATALLLFALVPIPAAGTCLPGSALCSDRFCTVSGAWHIGWEVPLNGIYNGLVGFGINFPPYLLAVFVLPLIYGAWRLVIFHAITGPILATVLAPNPLEMPAVWCLFSIGIVLVALTPAIRKGIAGPRPAT